METVLERLNNKLVEIGGDRESLPFGNPGTHPETVFATLHALVWMVPDAVSEAIPDNGD